MIDLVNLLKLVFSHYISSGLIVALCLLSVWVITRRWRDEIRIGFVMLALACIVLIARSLYREYHILSLGGELDGQAEVSLNILRGRLGDQYLARALVKGDHNPNERFYLALLAAERGLVVPQAQELQQPLFFNTNSYNTFAKRVRFPSTYDAFARIYQDTFLPNAGTATSGK